MKKTYDQFLETIESPGLKRSAKSLKMLHEVDFENCTPEMIKALLIDAHPVSEKVVATYLTIMKKYAFYLGRNDIVRMVRMFSYEIFWEEYKYSTKKYISKEAFDQFCNRINLEEPHNALHKVCLARCIYEGIYNDDLSVLMNLRQCDIHGNIVTLRPDNGSSYDLEISPELAEDLIELSKIFIWKRDNHFGTISETQMEGREYNSCFKTAQKEGSGKSKTPHIRYVNLYRSLTNKYVEYRLTSYDTFLSGLAYRITENLKKEGLNAIEVFERYSGNKKGFEIIQKELDRCHYKTTMMNFISTIRSHIHVFCPE